ncbi:MAG: hypothetical protein J6S28_05545 [Clostridia bacterium]|nr:hypothetical protein [Clostridia bacterium]
MKKRIAIALVCVVLLCALAACDMEFGGLVGELLSDADLSEGGFMDSLIGVVPPSPAIDPEETYTMGPGEELYGFPDSLNLSQELIMFEASDGIGFHNDTGAEVIDQAFVAMEEQFTGLYGYEIYHKQTLTGAEIIELAVSETQVSSGMIMLCYLPLSSAGEVAMSGAFHNQNSLEGFEMNNGCWFGRMNADLQFEGAQYSFAGYLTPYAQLDANCLVFNEDLMNEIGYQDIYDIVNSGAWENTKYIGICTEATSDLNGNGSINQEDRVGTVYERYESEAFVLKNSGIEIFTNGTYGENTVSFCNLLYSSWAHLERVSCEAQNPQEMFLSGNALFYATTLSRVAGLDGKDALCTYASFPVCVVPVPDMVGHYVPAAASCNRGSFLSVSRSGDGEVGMALNVLSVLAANHMQPAIEELIYKVNPNPNSANACFTVMENARCCLDLTLLQVGGHEVKPLREGSAVYLQGYKKEFVTYLEEVYQSVRENN